MVCSKLKLFFKPGWWGASGALLDGLPKMVWNEKTNDKA
jgi:hypothetical protein